MHFYIKHIAFIFLCWIATLHGVAQNSFSMPLDEGWKLRNAKQTSWMDVSIPSCVQSELMVRKFMANPFWGNNEKDCRWVENEKWEYAVYFDVAPSLFSQKNIAIVFEGLDTYAKIKLNGTPIAETDNMHRTWVLDIKKFVNRSSNSLTIEFTGAQAIADTLSVLSPIKLPTDARAYCRKAAYQFGWDFAPRLMTMGICKPVRIIASDESISPYPVYSFLQPMATFDSTKFQFSIDGKPVFIKGINIVPPSSLYPTANAYYDSLINVCKILNINMLRVWGGGVYPPEYFYDLCDENKILIWQDFMFANALMPADENTKSKIINEVEDAVRKLRHHTSIVLWCGNNEVEEGWKNWGWQKQYTEEQQNMLWQNYQQLYNVDIPYIIKIWDDARPYVSTSPKHGWGRTESMTDGDAHYWGVWWGKEPIDNYWYKVPRFMSEYGMQAMPDLHSVLSFCEPKNLKFTDTVFTNHQKHPTGFETMRHYLNDYPENKDSLGYIYFTQMMQRDALKTAISAHRSAFPYCNGTMPWQLNDVWPGISWSIIDYYNRPKASFYAIKDLYAKNALVLGKFIAQGNQNLLDTSVYEYALSICEPQYEITNLKTRFTVYDFYGEIMYQTDRVEWKKGEGGNYYTTSFFDKKTFDSYNWNLSFLYVEIKNKDGLLIEQPFYFAKPKQLKLQPTFYEMNWIDKETFTIGSLQLAKDVLLYCSNPNVSFSNNYFDVLPTIDKTIRVKGFQQGKDSIQIFSQIDMLYE
jgi:beta-mannosidase